MTILDQASPAAPAIRGMTVVQARRALSEMFRRASLDSPELDARLLTGHALGLDHTGLTIEAGRAITDDEARAIDALAARRLTREPVARILGHKEFWGLTLRLSAATLVPRPDTETVVEAALAAVDSGGPRQRPLRIADLGTGSGALLVALLTELPNALGVATDVESGSTADCTRQHAAARARSARALRCQRLQRSTRRTVRCHRVQSALRDERRHRGPCSRGPSRSTPRARRWPGRARLLSHHCGTGGSTAQAWRPFGGGIGLRSGGPGGRNIPHGGPCAAPCRHRPLRCPTGSMCSGAGITPCSTNIADRQKIAWIMGRDRLASL